ncbi:hypothetical protein DFH06DRAFT_501235 [Mycena polygramma]|nr:hypothetical protein DFH06DRAFT_501235 [Mycena polygramma]
MWHRWLPEPPTAEYIALRLHAATVLTESQIPCIVWGEEALRWIHRVPTFVFSTLHLLVPDDQLECASDTLTRLLPYAVVDPRTDDPHPWLLVKGEKERFRAEGRLPYAAPSTIKLSHTAWVPGPVLTGIGARTDTPQHILLSPDSFFHLSATDARCLVTLPSWNTVTLPPSLYELRFPALPNMYDTLTNAPNKSQYSFGLCQKLREYLAYLHLYRFSAYVKKWYKEVEDLPDSIREVGLALRQENQPRFWAMWLRNEPFSDDDSDDSNSD